MANIVHNSTNPVVLLNKGIPADFYVLKRDEQGAYVRPYQREFDDEGLPITERRWIRFTNSVLASIEEPEPLGWGSLQAWQEASEAKAFRTITQTIALVFDLWTTDKDGVPVPDWKLAGELMVDGGAAQYLVACTYAVLLAQGVDPTRVGSSLQNSLREVRESMLSAGEQMEEEVLGSGMDTPTVPDALMSSRGGTGSEDGSVLAGASPSSGT